MIKEKATNEDVILNGPRAMALTPQKQEPQYNAPYNNPHKRVGVCISKPDATAGTANSVKALKERRKLNREPLAPILPFCFVKIDRMPAHSIVAP